MYNTNNYYNTYAELMAYVDDFNKNNDIQLSIDTIRITFQKQHKLQELKNLGNWKKLNKSSEQIKRKLSKRLDADEVASVYQYEKENIYFYNSNLDKPKYRIATLVIFGMKQYHKKPPSQELVQKLVNLLSFGTSKNESSIDVCFDTSFPLNLKDLKKYFYLKRYVNPSTKKPTETHYINDTGITMLDKICIYNKALKNSLECTLYRIEATISIPNLKALQLPLNEFKSIIDFSRGFK